METCFLCGSHSDLTKDHIPPKGLFPKPRPNNLVTVPCCRQCNNASSKDDEYFRLAVSSLINANPTGRLIWKKRVVESTLKKRRIGNHIDTLRKEISPAIVNTPFGDIQAAIIPIDADIVNRMLVKITKGLLSVTHPEIVRDELNFEITQIHQFKLGCITDSGVAQTFTHYSVGEGVYRHWRALAKEDSRLGVWVHMFYDAATWLVKHEPKKN